MPIDLNAHRRLVVLDDDPTGIQTVHGCLILTHWSADLVDAALEDSAAFFYILTNSRALPAAAARQRVHEAVVAVSRAAALKGCEVLYLARSDSTLRGHFPLEIETIVTAAGLVPDARIFVPAFIEGRRVTEGNVHYLETDRGRMACHETEFARDSVFAYHSAHLPDYIAEKTGGAVRAQDVASLERALLDGCHDAALRQRLASIGGGRYVVVNAVTYAELDRLTTAVGEALRQGRRFVFQSAASLVKSLTGCPNRPFIHGAAPGRRPGLVVVGSHVEKTTVQLDALLANAADVIAPVAIDVAALLASEAPERQKTLKAMACAGREGKTPVLFTSRRELVFADRAARIEAGARISTFLSRAVAACPFAPRFCIAKGGITAHDVLTRGLGVKAARVLGQAAAGVPVIEMPPHHRWPGMNTVIFPGNVGAADTLWQLVQSFYRQ